MFDVADLRVIRIRRDDAIAMGELQQLLERCSDYYELHEGEPARATAAADEFDMIPATFSRDDIFILGFQDASGLIAELSLLRGYPKPEEWWVALFVVDPARRGRGIGERICDAMFRWIGSGTIAIAVDEENPRGEKFWRSLGFEETGRRDYTAPTAMQRRVIIMRKRLP